MIKFKCPSGHTLTAPENLAGRSAKCPKCDATLVIPSESTTPGGGGSSVEISGSRITPAMGSGKNLLSPGEVFVFLCPNGHKLNGPPSLKGKAGQCPHCGARFLIPTDEEIAAAEAAAQSSDDEELLGDMGSDAQSLDFDGQQSTAAETNTNMSFATPPAGPPGLGYIVARLWEQRTEGSELEIFLSEGEILAPDFYSEPLSTSDYGVFAIQESDGSFAVSVIPWNTVRRVGLRRMADLPGDLFQ